MKEARVSKLIGLLCALLLAGLLIAIVGLAKADAGMQAVRSSENLFIANGKLIWFNSVDAP